MIEPLHAIGLTIAVAAPVVAVTLHRRQIENSRRAKAAAFRRQQTKYFAAQYARVESVLAVRRQLLALRPAREAREGCAAQMDEYDDIMYYSVSCEVAA